MWFLSGFSSCASGEVKLLVNTSAHPGFLGLTYFSSFASFFCSLMLPQTELNKMSALRCVKGEGHDEGFSLEISCCPQGQTVRAGLGCWWHLALTASTPQHAASCGAPLGLVSPGTAGDIGSSCSPKSPTSGYGQARPQALFSSHKDLAGAGQQASPPSPIPFIMPCRTADSSWLT